MRSRILACMLWPIVAACVILGGAALWATVISWKTPLRVSGYARSQDWYLAELHHGSISVVRLRASDPRTLSRAIGQATSLAASTPGWTMLNNQSQVLGMCENLPLKSTLIHSSTAARYPGLNYTLALIPIWFPVVAALILPMAVLTRFAIRYTYRRLHPDPNHCPNCRYNLTANQSGKCPECGTPLGSASPISHGANP